MGSFQSDWGRKSRDAASLNNLLPFAGLSSLGSTYKISRTGSTTAGLRGAAQKKTTVAVKSSRKGGQPAKRRVPREMNCTVVYGTSFLADMALNVQQICVVEYFLQQ